MSAHRHAQRTYGPNLIPEGLPGGIFVYRADGDLEICYCDHNVVELYGCADADEFRDFVGNSFRGMVHPKDFPKIQNDISAQTFTEEKRHDYVRFRIVTKSGEVRYVEDFGHLLHGADGTSYFCVCIVDVDRDEYYNKLSNSFAESQVLSSMLDSDRLTGLMSQRAFLEEAQALMDAGERLTFAHLNILHFKVYNEEQGYQAGDDLLCHLARVLADEFEGALVARFSDDNFEVCTRMGVSDVTERVTRVHNTLTRSKETFRAEVKAGIYALEEACTQAGTACDHARIACSTIKRRYDRVVGVFDANLYESLRLQQYVIDNVEQAVDEGWMEVFYQPIVRISTGKICGYEALARWDDPTMGFLPPSSFVNTLEEFRMVHTVDCFVLRRVCEDLAALKAAGEPLVPVSVNLSRLDFELCDVFTFTEHCRIEAGVDPGLIDIEITESTLNENSLFLVDAIEQFRSAGYRVWVDDFGSGYSALNSLLDYEFDVLKLDLEFLRTFDEHPRAGVLIENVINMARGMGVEPLQEGVERAEHMEFLRQVGCEMVQGYYFARPAPLAESRRVTRAKGLEWE